MSKKITVTGIGNVNTKPDYVEISITIETEHKDYEKTMELSAEKNQQLIDALCQFGFEKESLKTTSFDIDTRYKSVKDTKGDYHSVFRGYEVRQRLKLSFDFSMKTLSKALCAISNSESHPEFSVRFTVKDKNAINEKMLRTATANAKKNAEILCDAAGVKLGNLISINYSWDELDVYSHTRYELNDCAPCEAETKFSEIDINPEDISVSDSATFEWEII